MASLMLLGAGCKASTTANVDTGSDTASAPAVSDQTGASVNVDAGAAATAGQGTDVAAPAGDSMKKDTGAAKATGGAMIKVEGGASAAVGTKAGSAGAATGGATGSGAVAVTKPAPVAATIQNFSFQPPKLTVKKGTTVTWTNKDSVGHTVTGDNGGPASALISQGQSYSFTFDTVGTFAYHCQPHPMMKGTVEVTE